MSLLLLPAWAADPFAANKASLDSMEKQLSAGMEELTRLRLGLDAHKSAHPGHCPGAKVLEERRELLAAYRRSHDSFGSLAGVYDHDRDQFAMASLTVAGLAARDFKGRRARAKHFDGASMLQVRMEFGNDVRAFGEQSWEYYEAERGINEEALESCRRARKQRLWAAAAALLLLAGLGAAYWRLASRPVVSSPG